MSGHFERLPQILEIASRNEGKTSSTWCLRNYITDTFTSVLPKSFRFWFEHDLKEWSELNRENTNILFLDADCVAPPLSYSVFFACWGAQRKRLEREITTLRHELAKCWETQTHLPGHWGRFCGRLHKAMPNKGASNRRIGLKSSIFRDRALAHAYSKHECFHAFSTKCQWGLLLRGDFLGALYTPVVWWYTTVHIECISCHLRESMYYCYKRNAKSHIFTRRKYRGATGGRNWTSESRPVSSSGLWWRQIFCFRKEDSYSLLDRKAMSFGVLCDGQMHHFLGVVWNLGPLLYLHMCKV